MLHRAGCSVFRPRVCPPLPGTAAIPSAATERVSHLSTFSAARASDLVLHEPSFDGPGSVVLRCDGPTGSIVFLPGRRINAKAMSSLNFIMCLPKKTRMHVPDPDGFGMHGGGGPWYRGTTTDLLLEESEGGSTDTLSTGDVQLSDVEAGVEFVHSIIEEERALVPDKEILIGGAGQGAVIALAAGLERDHSLAGIVLMDPCSSGLAAIAPHRSSPPGTRVNVASHKGESLDGDSVKQSIAALGDDLAVHSEMVSARGKAHFSNDMNIFIATMFGSYEAITYLTGR